MVATLPLFLFISYFGVPKPRIELGTALQQHDALPVGYVATLVGYTATLMGYVATLVGYVTTLWATLIPLWATPPP